MPVYAVVYTLVKVADTRPRETGHAEEERGVSRTCHS
jgi:hypothetical protein